MVYIISRVNSLRQERASDAPARAPADRGPLLTAAVLLIAALAAAVSVDVVRAGFGLKGDEATYVAMTLSAAYDGDLTYQRADLERFWGIYRGGPEGIFPKRGKQIRIGLRAPPPFLRVSRRDDPRTDRLYYGKPLIYPLAAAPFVRLLGMNGFLVFHVLLMFGAGACGYLFLRAGSRPWPAAAFAAAFIGASVVPVYAVFLTPEIFNFAIVFYAYFLWLHKEATVKGSPYTDAATVKGTPHGGSPHGLLRGFGSDIAAAVLIGSATYSKPSNAALIVPVVLLFWWRRRILRGILIGVVFAAATAAWFGLNALSSGEFNYQGGDRKTFYARFPFDAPDATWDARGLSMTTNESDAENVLAPNELPARFLHNVEYFLVGRHFGFVPYFFPGVVAIGLWLGSRERSSAWRLLSFAGAVAGALGLLLLLPYTWSGGGGPPGNRYFLSIYPAVFFVTPPLVMDWPVLFAWAGGALFTAKLVLNPFVAAKFTWQTVERGPVRRLPVELTMANDLPIMLDAPRARIGWSFNPRLLLYFLDENAYTPDPQGIWISGSGRADILVRSEQPLEKLVMTASSPIHTTFTASFGGSAVTVRLEPGKPVTFDLPADGVRGLQSYAYLLSARSSDGFVPHLENPTSTDTRNLGALIMFKGILK